MIANHNSQVLSISYVLGIKFQVEESITIRSSDQLQSSVTRRQYICVA